MKKKGSEKRDKEHPAPKKKKRGRPSLQRAEEAAVEEPEKAESSKAKKRGRLSKTQQELKATHKSALASQGAHGKPSDSGAEARKRRTRRSDASDTNAGFQAPASSTATVKKTRKTRKDTGVSADDEGSATNSTAKGKSIEKRREADTSVLGAGKSQDKEERSERRPVQKPRRDDQQESQTSQTEKAPAYQHLAEVIHRVSRQIIEDKWDPLPQSCIERVSSLLEDIQRPVVVRVGDERRRTQASTALQMVSRRLVSKISKGLPFPQSSGPRRDDDFDFEKILDRSRDLEAQLTQALHANALLESELQKETAHLEAEEEALSQLETNAKTEASRRRETRRKLHSLLQTEDPSATDDGLGDDTGLAVEAHHAPLSLVILTLLSLNSHNANYPFRRMRSWRRSSRN